MTKLLPLFAVGAAALGLATLATTANAEKWPKFDLCHFPGHVVEDDVSPTHWPRQDHPIHDGAPGFTQEACESRGGIVITGPCVLVKAHLGASDEAVENFCEFLR